RRPRPSSTGPRSCSGSSPRESARALPATARDAQVTLRARWHAGAVVLSHLAAVEVTPGRVLSPTVRRTVTKPTPDVSCRLRSVTCSRPDVPWRARVSHAASLMTHRAAMSVTWELGTAPERGDRVPGARVSVPDRAQRVPDVHETVPAAVRMSQI